jgi:hypothetical protein
MTTAPRWMPVYCVVRAQRTVHAAHPSSKIPPQAREANEDFWQRVGTATANADGGFTLRLFAMPVGGELVMRPPSPHDHFDPTTKG